MTARDHSLGGGWIPVGDVLLAAMERGVLVGAIHDLDGIPEHAQVLVVRGDSTWAVYRSRDSLDWVAVRLHPDGTDLPGTLCRLGAADADAGQIVDALLDAESLPTARP